MASFTALDYDPAAPLLLSLLYSLEVLPACCFLRNDRQAVFTPKKSELALRYSSS